MDKLRTVSFLATLGLVAAAFAQAQTPPADTQSAAPPETTTSQTTPSPDPAAASSPHQRDVTAKPGSEAPPTNSPEPDAASSPHQQGTVGAAPHAGMMGTASKMVGLQVQSPVGETLGSVIDVVLDSSGRPDYVVISTDTDTATAVPYAAVAPMVRNDKVILDRTRLQNSPQVAQSDLHDKTNTKWRTQADRYWGQGTMRSASPGTQPSQTPRDR